MYILLIKGKFRSQENFYIFLSLPCILYIFLILRYFPFSNIILVSICIKMMVDLYIKMSRMWVICYSQRSSLSVTQVTCCGHYSISSNQYIFTSRLLVWCPFCGFWHSACHIHKRTTKSWSQRLLTSILQLRLGFPTTFGVVCFGFI